MNRQHNDIFSDVNFIPIHLIIMSGGHAEIRPISMPNPCPCLHGYVFIKCSYRMHKMVSLGPSFYQSNVHLYTLSHALPLSRALGTTPPPHHPTPLQALHMF